MSGDHETVDLIKSIRSRISLRAYLRSVDEYYRTHPIRRWLIPQVHHDVRRYLLDVLEALDTMNGAPICGDVSPIRPRHGVRPRSEPRIYAHGGVWNRVADRGADDFTLTWLREI